MEYPHLPIQVTPSLLAIIFLLYRDLKPRRLNCAESLILGKFSFKFGKELSGFVSLIARKSTCVHTNSNKASSLFLTELTLIYERQTFLDVLVKILLNCFLPSQY